MFCSVLESYIFLEKKNSSKSATSETLLFHQEIFSKEVLYLTLTGQNIKNPSKAYTFKGK